jgi:HSP20 family molecular chaperone IbpA
MRAWFFATEVRHSRRELAKRAGGLSEAVAWSPKIDVFAKNNRLVTRVDLPGMKRRTSRWKSPKGISR